MKATKEVFKLIKIFLHIVLFCSLAATGFTATCPQGEVKLRKGESLFFSTENPDYPQIEKLFRRAMQECPHWSKPARYLADIMAEQGNFQEAVTLYQEALERDKNDFEAMLYLGDAYLEKGQQIHALRFFTKGIRIIETDNRLLRDNRSLLNEYQPLRKMVAARVVYVDAEQAANHLNRAKGARLGVKPTITTTIGFVKNSAEIEEDWKAQLDTLAEVLTSKPMQSYRQIIRGYADVDGTNVYNFHLSGKRAEAVHHYLLEQGVADKNIFFTEGLGEEEQLKQKSGESALDWKKRNRRVIFVSCGAAMDRETCLRSAGM